MYGCAKSDSERPSWEVKSKNQIKNRTSRQILESYPLQIKRLEHIKLMNNKVYKQPARHSQSNTNVKKKEKLTGKNSIKNKNNKENDYKDYIKKSL